MAFFTVHSIEYNAVELEEKITFYMAIPPWLPRSTFHFMDEILWFVHGNKSVKIINLPLARLASEVIPAKMTHCRMVLDAKILPKSIRLPSIVRIALARLQRAILV